MMNGSMLTFGLVVNILNMYDKIIFEYIYVRKYKMRKFNNW